MDEYFPLAIAVIFIVLVVGAAITFALIFRRIGKLNEVYARLADSYKGQATSGWLFIRPTLTFQREGTMVNVHTIRRGRREGEDILEIACDWPDHRFWMKLQDRRLPRYLTRWFATEEIRTGDPSFDDRFQLCGNDASLLTDALASAPKAGAATGRALIEMLRSLQVDDLSVRVDRGQFVVRKQGAFYSYEELSELISVSLALFGYLKTISTKPPSSPPLPPRTAAVELLRLRNDWTCQICGEGPLRDGSSGKGTPDELVVCRRCKSPHHKDCWTYNGVCSTYGCGETRCMHSPHSKQGAMS